MLQNVWLPLYLSLQVAFFASLFNLIAGCALAWYLAQRQSTWRSALDILCTLPMVLPPTVLGYYLLVLLGSQGSLGRWLKEGFGINLIFSIEGAIVAAAVVTFPLFFKPARAAFEAVPTNLQQAALVLGLPRWLVFFRMVLPLAWRGVLAGLLLGFVRAMGEFGATLMIAGNIPGKTQTLSIAIYDAVQAGDDASANFMVLVISAVCIALLVLANWVQPRRRGVL